MAKFSDSPYFLLKDFFYELNHTVGMTLPECYYKWSVSFVSTLTDGPSGVVYTDVSNTFDVPTGIDNIVFTDHNLTRWNLECAHNPNEVKTFNSYIVAPTVNITTFGNGIFTLYVKDDDQGYVPISVKYKNTEDNTFNFYNTGIGEYTDGENIIEHLTNDYSYTFNQWDAEQTDGLNIIENGQQCFFRKDGYYHDWCKGDSHDYYEQKWNTDLTIRNYHNTDKVFSFFDFIYKSHDNTECRIIFDGMKDYVMRAIPEHQRTPKFTDFQEVFFDRLYQEGFDLLKNIWTMIYPMEVDEKYLGYLSKYYDMFDVDVEGASKLHIREFIRDMVWMIKRKGTYTEYFILWRLLTATQNRLSIYERWHEKYEDDGVTIIQRNILDEEWEDYLYTYKPEYDTPTVLGGAGDVYYANDYPTTIENYVETEKVLSTHFILETDLTDESLLKYEILTEDLWDTMHKYWEYVRPVSRVCTYRIVIAPQTDFTGNSIGIYEEPTSFVNSTSTVYSMDLQGAYVHSQQEESTSWSFSHKLGSKGILVQVIDAVLDEIIPSQINFIDDNNISIDFEMPESGYVLCKRYDSLPRRFSTSGDIWNLHHLRDQKEVIVHYQYEDQKMYEGETTLTDPDYATAVVYHNEVISAPTAEGNYIFFQTTPAQTWEIVGHPLNKKGVLMSVYDDNDVRMHPSEYRIIDIDECTITFDTPQTGYIVLVAVGNLSFDDLLDDFEAIMTNPTWRVYNTIGSYDLDKIPLQTGLVESFTSDDNFYYIEFKLPPEDGYIINEMTIHDDEGTMVFYTENSDLYKPAGVEMTIHYKVEKRI